MNNLVEDQKAIEEGFEDIRREVIKFKQQVNEDIHEVREHGLVTRERLEKIERNWKEKFERPQPRMRVEEGLWSFGIVRDMNTKMKLVLASMLIIGFYHKDWILTSAK